MSSSLNPGPALGGLRVAMPEDILRIGIVATSGFRYSPLFRWERPYHEDYPEDTLLSYRTQFQNAMKSDDLIVLVAEDEYQPDEDSKTDAIIPSNNGWEAPSKDAKVVVGVASIKLEPTSQRKGQFKHKHGTYPVLPENPERDLNRKHYDSWGSLVGEAREKFCSGDAVMSMLVVHPAYWARGHGTELVKWAVELSKCDNVKQCVSAAGMGFKLYSKLGYVEICRISADGDEDDSEGVSTDLMEFCPS